MNCIAELLDDPDDEIIFVDYNTPDDLGTFVDAIGDMLTPKARRLLRTLRIRPADHARFAKRTHLRCLESPARNAALRRSNPRNRWILSTNTDMVFVPRDGRSLSAIAASLPDGFYHTARFEVPEILWETLDRSNPSACIEAMRDWGKRFQINEVIYGYPATIFDGPGDFQLFLREDGFRIGGFDERMLLGWHVDSNIAVRLSMLRNADVGSVLDYVFAYHCDHTRESTPAHAHGAVQNDWEKFVSQLSDFAIPEQAHDWGLADSEIEVDRVDGSPPIIAALERVLEPMGNELPIMSIVNPRDLRYDPEHAVPHVANAIGALPKTWNVGYDGCRKKLFKYFLGLWRELGFVGKILLPTDAAAMLGTNEAASAEETSFVEIVDEQTFHSRPDFYCFEMSLMSDDTRPPSGYRKHVDDGLVPVALEDHRRLLQVHRSYSRTIDYTREHGLTSRRFVLVNMLNNAFQRMASWQVGTAATPTGSHLTHGFVLGDPFTQKRPDPVTWLQSRLGGPTRLTAPIAQAIVEAVAPRGYLHRIPYLGALAADVALVLSMSEAPVTLSATRERLDKAVEEIERRRFSLRIRDESGLRIVAAPDPHRNISRIAAFEDFDDAQWGRLAVRAHGPVPVRDPFLRVRAIWEAAHALYALEHSKLLAGKVLFIKHPQEPPITRELILSALSDWSGECAIADATGSLAVDEKFDAVVLSNGTTKVANIENLPAVFMAVDQVLKVGGLCLGMFDLVIKGTGKDTIDLARLRSGIFDVSLARETAWRLEGPVDLSISTTTLDTLEIGKLASIGTLVYHGSDGSVRIPCPMAFVKEGETSRKAWDRYYGDYAGRPATAPV
ncbi:MAG: hypothetical protein ABSE64_16745 [Vulcanimicrobiaceae bacterium]